MPSGASGLTHPMDTVGYEHAGMYAQHLRSRDVPQLLPAPLPVAFIAEDRLRVVAVPNDVPRSTDHDAAI